MDKQQVAIAIRQAYISRGIMVKVSFAESETADNVIKATDLTELALALPQEPPSSITVEDVGTFNITKSEKTGRLAGKVVIVTGSAQGFGEGIAKDLATHGCYLVFADLNLEAARKNAEAVNAKYNEGTAIAALCDVGSEESVEKMIAETVATFGGLDLFVANAGILIAGAIDDLTLEQFELVTKVNYTAFFICSKYAAKVMKLQKQVNPRATADIIQVNSKSGLEGSNKNFAYAGSKFGGIGLTQSFAKELIDFGIKVNAVCPGNFYEGPLWSDPKNGLFVQFLKAGKVPGAKTVDDVKESYLSKVPIHRGCYPEDVTVAVLYCVEQQYETGQAIAVTGGQNMLK